jgi:lysophospholipase L1-like esterase
MKIENISRRHISWKLSLKKHIYNFLSRLIQKFASDETAAPVKTILCFGDSNVWGTIPGGGKFPRHERWVGIMAQKLGDEYRVIDEGLCGRTVNCDDDDEPGVNRNGLKTLKTILISHSPVDLLIIMLGTNDQKARFNRSGADIAENLRLMVLEAMQDYGYGPPPHVLLICPPSLTEKATAQGKFPDGPEKSKQLRDALSNRRSDFPAPVIYADDYINNDSADGIHLSRNSNRALGNAVAAWVENHLQEKR